MLQLSGEGGGGGWGAVLQWIPRSLTSLQRRVPEENSMPTMSASVKRRLPSERSQCQDHRGMTTTCCPGSSKSFWRGFALDITEAGTLTNLPLLSRRPIHRARPTKMPPSQSYKRRHVACQHPPDDQTLRLQTGVGEDDVIHLPSGLDRVDSERQEEEESFWKIDLHNVVLSAAHLREPNNHFNLIMHVLQHLVKKTLPWAQDIKNKLLVKGHLLR